MCQALEIEYLYFDLSDGHSAKIFGNLFPEEGQVPQVLWQGEHIGGYSELKSKIDEYINGEIK